MDIDRVEDIARDPDSATRRERRQATWFAHQSIEADDEDEFLLPHERCRLEAAKHKLSIFEREVLR